MGAFTTNQESATYYKLQAGKKDEKPFFGKKGSKADNYKVIEEHDAFEGSLLNIELGDYEFEGKKKDTIKLTFEDTLGKCIVEGSLNTSIMRSILNTFAGGDFNKPFVMKLYLNKEGYPSVYITQGGERASWKYETTQLPKVEIIKMKNGNEIKDDTDVVVWVKNLVTNELKPRLKETTLPPNKSLPNIADVPTEKTADRANVSGGNGMSQEQSDDLPF
jgi:hypothetical protein